MIDLCVQFVTLKLRHSTNAYQEECSPKLESLVMFDDDDDDDDDDDGRYDGSHDASDDGGYDTSESHCISL